ncbi:Pex19 protein family-domain-containing protein [Calycina marina]|uniref:Pex19 protein family-domain-containing protein n=1 Tax=Calycina marina TaxID=1763456 RepID=A0A9P7YZJ2_9HELO|nr:Pex19 protein family-domain-containing protein [Calycina marina]
MLEKSEPAAAIPIQTSTEVEDIVPDPDEDDLDDLDDMLDEFVPSKRELKVPSVPSVAKQSDAIPDATEGISDDDFAVQLQAGMKDLLGELETSPDMQAQFESMLKEFSGAGAADTKAPSTTASTAKITAKSGPSSAAGEESFQETIKKTMERMKTSDSNATATASTASEDDLLANMMKAMASSGMGGGEGTDEDFSKMLLGMMEQLTNKEILYEPMKELHDKFPDWMERNKGKVPEEDMKRYLEQQTYVKEIVGRFEAKGYSDDNAKDREYIVERMQNMQAAGSPPPDLIGDMAAAQEAFGAPDEGCAQQ